MTEIGIWHITQNQPQRMQRSNVNLEKHLEDWIENDPSLVQQGLIIVGRQVHCAGGYIDLLAIDPYAQSWVVIEIKRGNIRRETLMQAVDYAASVHTMSKNTLRNTVDGYLQARGSSLKRLTDDSTIDSELFAEADREMKICVVGTGRDDGLERMVDFLVRKYNMSISLVEFDVFSNENGGMSLVRQLNETDAPIAVSQSSKQPETDLERLFALADQNRIGPAFRKIFNVATKHGLFPRTYKWSIMYTPPQNKTRCCVVAWVKPKSGKLRAYAIPETIAEFFPIREREVKQIIGPYEERLMTLDDASNFERAMDQLFERIRANKAE